MATPDYKTSVRKAMMAALKHDSGFTALIPAASIYPGTVPASRTFPFSRFGSVIAAPLVASGLDSSSFRLSLQAFTKDVKNGAGTTTITAEDRADAIGSAFKVALDDATLTLDTSDKARVSWIQSTSMRDGTEDGAWMVTSTFGVEVAG